MSSASLSIPEHYIRKYEKNWGQVVQQLHSKLRDLVMVKSFEGRELILTDFDDFEYGEDLGRLTRSNPNEVTAQKRKLFKRHFDLQKIWDRKDPDLLAQLGEPKSELMMNQKAALNRLIDDLIIEAASADAKGGPDPHDTAIPLPSGQKVDVNFVRTGTPANSGLTPHKILRARTIFHQNEVGKDDDDELILMVSPTDIENLTSYIESSGNDVWAKMLAQYEDNPNNKLFQFKVIESNRLAKNTSTDIETAFAFSKKKGICVGPEKTEIKVDELPAQKHARQFSAYTSYAATRRYEEGVVEIYCDHSP